MILIGKNRYHNTELVQNASPDDLWFHVANAPSPHVILEVDPEDKKKIPRSILKQCAILCKSHSSFRSDKKVPIHYTRVSNICVTNIPGQVTILHPHLLHTIVL
jgi:predicted ribosome quality control (RQC) complex YloA/Tae2 family protein